MSYRERGVSKGEKPATLNDAVDRLVTAALDLYELAENIEDDSAEVTLTFNGRGVDEDTMIAALDLAAATLSSGKDNLS